MRDIWSTAADGPHWEVEMLVEQDPGLLNAMSERSGWTPLMYASIACEVETVRWLVDQGAALNVRDKRDGRTALYIASSQGLTPVVKILVEAGADPTIATTDGSTPLMVAYRPEVVRVLLGDPRVKAIINERDEDGKTALRRACFRGRAGHVRALLEGGADPTIADNDGITPVAIAKQDPGSADVSAEGRQECVAVLEVRACHFFSPSSLAARPH
jgi:uncharacterized protein